MMVCAHTPETGDGPAPSGMPDTDPAGVLRAVARRECHAGAFVRLASGRHV